MVQCFILLRRMLMSDVDLGCCSILFSVRAMKSRWWMTVIIGLSMKFCVVSMHCNDFDVLKNDVAVMLVSELG